ncbi:lytic exoenzyme target recognition domain-containing protein [Leuconostoc lactis]|uniref:lytic exoenzyme target recognition domain-containing protein n=1 Tax=Leuconostoc lactis TaxID=1246 RepID=UPI000E819B30|nr:lytic exoenzyme target recognition domain-containing protein [Leuconostoc lactis]HBP98676.1 N-acetylmuramoyl-L-alanine amidase [Leuconostoc lactis]
MGYTIKEDIVVPNGYVYNVSALQPGFHQIHMHSTGNPTASVQNERDYLAGHYNAANYNYLVGITNGQVDIRHVMNDNSGAWDVGGDWNWQTYAAIEFSEGIKSQADFNKAYPAYIWLARYLAKKAGITYTIDNLNTVGIKSHNYASATGHGSDHVDPIPFLAKWGVSRDKFNRDLVNGVGDDTTVTPVIAPRPQPVSNTSAIQAFKNAGNAFTATRVFRVDEIKEVNGIWQMINYNLAGGRDFSWTNNGIPLDIVDNVTRGNQAATQIGDLVIFNVNYNNGTIDDYDNASNAVGIKYRNYGEIWFNADAFLKL